MSDQPEPTPDMSPEAVFRRLQEASDLLELCMSLGTARRLAADEDRRET